MQEKWYFSFENIHLSVDSHRYRWKPERLEVYVHFASESACPSFPIIKGDGIISNPLFISEQLPGQMRVHTHNWSKRMKLSASPISKNLFLIFSSLLKFCPTYVFVLTPSNPSFIQNSPYAAIKKDACLISVDRETMRGTSKPWYIEKKTRIGNSM